MEAIVKKGTLYSLIWISDNEGELELAQTKWDEVITTFTITDEEKALINNWATFTYNNWIVIWDKTIAEEALVNSKTEEIKAGQKEAINKIASLSDQLNLTAGTLHIIVDLLAMQNPELLVNPWIIESKRKLNEIKNILNK